MRGIRAGIYEGVDFCVAFLHKGFHHPTADEPIGSCHAHRHLCGLYWFISNDDNLLEIRDDDLAITNKFKTTLLLLHYPCHIP